VRFEAAPQHPIGDNGAIAFLRPGKPLAPMQGKYLIPFFHH
jgi:hypothetical protein